MRSLLPDGRYVFDATIKFAGYETQNRPYQGLKFIQTSKKVIKRKTGVRFILFYKSANGISWPEKRGYQCSNNINLSALYRISSSTKPDKNSTHR